MKYLFLLFATAGSLFCAAQKAPIKFGNIPDELLSMKTYPADTAAEAVIIADYGVSEITYNQLAGFELNFERTRRIKILTEAGKKWADFSVSLYKDSDQSEKLTSYKGVTVNLENGKAVESKLKSDAMFKEKYSDNLDIVKLSMPNVKVGSVIDITYKVKSEFLVNFQDWEFQSTIPVVWSEYRAKIPEYFIYDHYMQGYIPVGINEESRETGRFTLTETVSSGGRSAQRTTETETVEYILNTFRWAASNVPAFRDEPYMTTRRDYISKMNFELATIKMPGQTMRQVLGSWEEINKRMAESGSFLGEVTGNGFLRKQAETLTATATSAPQKIDAIVSYVKQNVAWDGVTSVYPAKGFKQVLEDKKGSSAEINLLIASMLEKVNINVRPVLLSTREHGFLREMNPAISQFNYVACVAKWDGGQVLIDGTSAYLPLGFLPSRCLNGQGMAVSKDGFEWIKLGAPSKTRSVITSTLQLSEDGTLSGKMELDHYGYEAVEKRKKYSTDGDAAYVKEIVGARPWQVTKSEFSNAADLKEAFKEKHEVMISEHISVAGDVMYMNPFLVGQWASNPFKSEKREYPVDFANAFDEVYILKMQVPDGFGVDELPPPKAVTLPGNAGRYLYNTAQTGNRYFID